MQAVSDAFLAAVATSHRLSTRVDVLYGGTVVVEDLAVSDGWVTLDGTASTLGRLRVDFREPTRLPTGPTSPLSPYGYELAVYRGVVLGDGTVERVPLGVFPIQDSAVNGVTLGTSITALDRSQRIRDAGLEDDYTIASGTNAATAIETLLNTIVPGLTYLFSSTAHTTPLVTLTPNMDPWEEAMKMARDIGMDLYFDGLGRCVLRPVPNLATSDPVAEFAEGEGGVLTNADLSLDRGPAYNRVIAYGSNASLAIVPRGVATDDDPASPTYYYGSFGKKPRRYASPFLTTNDQAAAAARAVLASNIGVAKSVNFGVIPNPAIEVGDVVTLTHADLGLATSHLVDVLTIGLSAESTMTGKTRVVQAVAA